MFECTIEKVTRRRCIYVCIRMGYNVKDVISPSNCYFISERTGSVNPCKNPIQEGLVNRLRPLLHTPWYQPILMDNSLFGPHNTPWQWIISVWFKYSSKYISFVCIHISDLVFKMMNSVALKRDLSEYESLNFGTGKTYPRYITPIVAKTYGHAGFR